MENLLHWRVTTYKADITMITSAYSLDYTASILENANRQCLYGTSFVLTFQVCAFLDFSPPAAVREFFCEPVGIATGGRAHQRQCPQSHKIGKLIAVARKSLHIGLVTYLAKANHKNVY